MTPWLLLVTYCTLILLASLAGGYVPMVLRLTHRRMQIALSFVSGVMLGVAAFELLPHAVEMREASVSQAGTVSFEPIALWALGGFLAMFFLERFFCFHHHDVPASNDQHEVSSKQSDLNSGHEHEHRHRLTWAGAAFGLTLHSILAGVALGAAVEGDGHHHETTAPAGLSIFLVICLHKPFDSLMLITLLAVGEWSNRARHAVNAVFALAVPVGVVLLYAGLGLDFVSNQAVLSAALAAAAGMFICISLSDLLPELQFHQHDRTKLSLALLLGLALAWGVTKLEHQGHDHNGTHDHQAIAVKCATSPFRHCRGVK